MDDTIPLSEDVSPHHESSFPPASPPSATENVIFVFPDDPSSPHPVTPSNPRNTSPDDPPPPPPPSLRPPRGPYLGQGLPTYSQAAIDPPPNYDEVSFEPQRTGSSFLGALGALSGSLCAICGIIVFLSLSFAVLLSSIVIGAIKWNAPCTTDKLSLFLVVFGVLSIVGSLLDFYIKLTTKKSDAGGEREQPRKKRKLSLLSFLINLTSTVWICLGCYWVYRYDPGPNYEFCDRFLYLYSFWLLTSSFILAGVLMVFGCCACCMALACIKK